MAVTERFDKEIGYGVMQVTRIYSKSNTKKDGNYQTDFLSRADLCVVPITEERTVNVDFTFFIVSATSHAFNEGTFCRMVIVVIEQIVHHILRATSAVGIHSIAQNALRVIVWTIVLKRQR